MVGDMCVEGAAEAVSPLKYMHACKGTSAFWVEVPSLAAFAPDVVLSPHLAAAVGIAPSVRPQPLAFPHGSPVRWASQIPWQLQALRLLCFSLAVWVVGFLLGKAITHTVRGTSDHVKAVVTAMTAQMQTPSSSGSHRMNVQQMILPSHFLQHRFHRLPEVTRSAFHQRWHSAQVRVLKLMLGELLFDIFRHAPFAVVPPATCTCTSQVSQIKGEAVVTAWGMHIT